MKESLYLTADTYPALAAKVSDVQEEAHIAGRPHWLVTEVSRKYLVDMCPRYKLNLSETKVISSGDVWCCTMERDRPGIEEDPGALGCSDDRLLCEKEDVPGEVKVADQLNVVDQLLNFMMERQYYTTVDEGTGDVDLWGCFWHDEGTGPYPNARYNVTADGYFLHANLTWRHRWSPNDEWKYED